MTPDPSAWRLRARYDQAEQFSASDFGWEWLRRNERYDADYQSFARTEADKGKMTERIGERWGLRFPCRSARSSAAHTRFLAA